MVDGTEARDRMIAAYALRCTSDEDLATFKQYLDQYTKEVMEAVARDLLTYLGMGEGVQVEVVHLTNELRKKLEKSGTLDDYLMGKDKCDDG
jgi:site-specific recombinase